MPSEKEIAEATVDFRAGDTQLTQMLPPPACISRAFTEEIGELFTSAFGSKWCWQRPA